MALADPRDFPSAAKSTYLNSASVGLMYAGAEEASTAWQRDIAENGTRNFDEMAENLVFDELRREFAELIGAQPKDIAVGSSATELMTSLAWAVAPERGRKVIAVDVAFPSTVYPWLRVSRRTGCSVRWVSARDGFISEADIAAAIDADTAVVCLSHVEYGSGQCYQLAPIAAAAHARGALLVVDATQSMGAIPLDVTEAGVDALITGSYKWLCGPFGVGLLYLTPHLQSSLDPGIVGWRSHREIYDLDATRLEYAPAARRFESSTMAYGSAIGLTRSLTLLRRLGVQRICSHNLHLADTLVRALKSLDAEIRSPESEAARSSIVSARFPGHDSQVLVRALGSRNIIASARRDFVRLSLHLYNTEADVAKVANAIDDILY